MTDARLSRRRFILTAVAASSVIAAPQRWLPGNTARADSATSPELTQLARQLFPHSGLASDVYADVAQSVFGAFVANAATAQLLDVADAALDARVGGDWMEVDEDRQLAALKSIESEAFFAAILAALRGAFYSHPKVWVHIDYPGSSKEYGGYKNRGFDDIDWLPEVE